MLPAYGISPAMAAGVAKILSLADQMQALSTVLMVIALLATALRLYAKWKLLGAGFSLDDSEYSICPVL